MYFLKTILKSDSLTKMICVKYCISPSEWSCLMVGLQPLTIQLKICNSKSCRENKIVGKINEKEMHTCMYLSVADYYSVQVNPSGVLCSSTVE